MLRHSVSRSVRGFVASRVARVTLLLASILTLVVGSAAHAQIKPLICTPPGCVVNYPPSVSVSPSSGSYTTGTGVVVTFTYCDSIQAVGSTQQVTFNGANVTSSFRLATTTSHPGCHYAQTSTGTVTLAQGTNTVSATVHASFSGNIWYATGTGTYTGIAPPQPLVAPNFRALLIALVPMEQYDTVQTTITHQYQVTNLGSNAAPYALQVRCTGSVSACQLASGQSASPTIPGGGSVQIPVVYTTSALNDSGTVWLIVKTTAWTPTLADSGEVISHATLLPTRGLTVKPIRPALQISPGTQIIPFVVSNRYHAAETVSASVTCTGGAFFGGCSVNGGSTFAIAAGATDTVSVQTTVGTTNGSRGTVKLVATPTAYPGGADSAWDDVAVGAVQAPGLVLMTPQHAHDVTKCLTISIIKGMAYQCGDLRIVHALPTVRTFNKSRQPTLLYRGRAEHPRVILSAWLTLNPARGVPDSVIGQVLESDGAVRAKGRWAGSDFAPTSTRFVSLSYATPSIQQQTPYTFQAMAYYGGTTAPFDTTFLAAGVYATDGQVASKYGAGWTLAGVEHLTVVPQPNGAQPILDWSGGDGSTNEYVYSNGRWLSTNLDRVDSITRATITMGVPAQTAIWYTRTAEHGASVTFDSATGHHIRTRDRVKHTTQFFYHSASGQEVDSIVVPTWSGVATYAFTYDTTGYLSSIAGPPVSGQSRIVSFFHNALTHRLVLIQDPDGSSQYYQYSPDSAHLMTSYIDPRGVLTAFTYDSGQALTQANRNPIAGSLTITLNFTPGETRGLAQAGVTARSVAWDSVYTLVNGPRLDTTITAYWIDALGQPTRIRDALGYQTILERTDARWPGLVTRVRHPSGQVIGATYDARGNLATKTDSTTYLVANGITTYATDSMTWNQSFDFVQRHRAAAGKVSWFFYDFFDGDRVAEQVDADSSSASPHRVSYWYSGGLLDSLKTPLAPAADYFTYDTLGNVSQTRSPLGYWATYVHDAVGRLTLTVSPIDSDDFSPFGGSNTHVHMYHYVSYDAMDRTVDERDSANLMNTANICPGYSGTWGAGGRVAHTLHQYNVDGTLASIAKWSAPDIINLGTGTTYYHTDVLGRQVAVLDPDSARDSTVLDAVGNVVARITRNGYTITTTYDALNRAAKRMVPSTTPFDTTTGANGAYPRYFMDNNDRGELSPGTSQALGVPADTMTFTYDPAGRIRTAFNRDAHVSRTYNPNGTIATDTLAIRTYTGVDFSTHVYGLSYGYDLDLHRTSITQPANLVGSGASGIVSATEQYSYSTDQGVLVSAIDVMGNAFGISYDNEERVTSIGYAPNGASPITWEHFGYDGDARLEFRSDSTSVYVGAANGWESVWIRNDTLTHDGRGKLLDYRIHEGQYHHPELIRNRYDGMGQLVDYSRTVVNTDGTFDFQSNVWDAQQWMFNDGFGNHGNMLNCSGQINVAGTFETHTGRLLRQSGGGSSQANEYDAAGNTHFTHNYGGFEMLGANTFDDDERINFYSADNVLRYTDRRANWLQYDTNGTGTKYRYYRTYFTELRYDALGRRVMMRARPKDKCGTDGVNLNCYGTIERYVWDDKAVLWEVQYPGGDTISVSDLERDTVTIPAPHDSRFYGRVLYLNRPGLDRPFDLVRYGYGYQYDATTYQSWSPVTIVPHYDWHDAPVYLSFQNGQQQLCVAGSTSICLLYQLPDATAAFLNGNAVFLPTSWVGNAVDTKTEKNGVVYMRNRFYDPTSGLFTQEDPQDLGSGLNAYGFATGDPVNYADPFGLCTAPSGQGIGICFDTFIPGGFILGGGDHRMYSAFGGTYKTEVQFSIDPATGKLSGQRWDIGSTDGHKGTGNISIGDAEGDGQGGWNVRVAGHALNGFNFGPDIDFDLKIHVTAQGQVSVPCCQHDGFPAYEVWKYQGGQQPSLAYQYYGGTGWGAFRLIPYVAPVYPYLRGP
jgi:RHS repeat-associated protein